MIKSMTAFARRQRQEIFGQFCWEIRSVNHRYLDISFRLPERFRELEITLREAASVYLKRGKVECSLRYSPGTQVTDSIVLNHEILQQLQKAYQQLKSGFSDPVNLSFTDLLRWPGVMQAIESEQPEEKQTILSLFEESIQELDVARQREGSHLTELIQSRLNVLEEQLRRVTAVLPQILEAQREKLIMRFEEAKIKLDSERLEQEIVFVAQKIDVTEELDRLKVHVEEARRALKADQSCGRRLDFLMQEFNREANTLGSKSISEVTTAVSIELKVLIEQMREQVQNIE